MLSNNNSFSHSFVLPDQVHFSSKFFIDQFSGLSHYQSIFLSGPLGSLSFSCPSSFSFTLSDSSTLTLSSPSSKSLSPALFRSFLSFFSNSLVGISSGFSLSLSLVGVGYKASVSEDNFLSLNIGFSHPVLIPIPPSISVSCPTPNTILASSFSFPLLSSFLHSIRLIRPSSSDPYKSKGLSLSSS